MIVEVWGTVLVTGSTTGIGAAVASEFHDAGATVFVHGRTVEKASATVEELGGGERLFAVGGDLSTAAGCRQVCEAVDALCPNGLDVLVSNAGIYPHAAGSSPTWEEFEEVFAVNLKAGAMLAAHFVPQMIERNRGSVIVVASEMAKASWLKMLPYSASNGARLHLTDAWARECAGTNVRVNVVLPGPTMAAGNEQIIADLMARGGAATVEHAQAMISATRPEGLLGRWTTPQEVAAPIVFLASDWASGITGACLDVSGGMARTVLS